MSAFPVGMRLHSFPLSPEANIIISIQTDDFDPAAEQQALCQNSNTGAIVTFTGLVRDMNAGENITGLYLEHYPGMTERSLEKIVDEAQQRWSLNIVKVIHRVGQLHTGDQIVFVGTASAHRSDSFSACAFIMDYLKTRAPFWKKETTTGGDRWLDARDSDQIAAKRWDSGDPRC